ncbi:MAG: ion transporter [Saprospiraceae bacterium]|nr:ion transporter [Saprospiraceae bacterium]
MSQKFEQWSPLRRRLHGIIFEAETVEGRLFDIILLLAILLSVIIVMLETVPSYQLQYGRLFTVLEWIFTFIFLIEYGLRIYCVKKPWNYIFSFFGLVDLMSILPIFLSLIFVGTQSLMIIRGIRLLRVFRIFKLVNFLSQGQIIMAALKASREKIFLFMIFILILVSIFGSLMYLIEGRTNAGFDSIPRSIYWAIVTLTTVGYGDISPQSPIGQFLASLIMIAGYSILAVPTGIVTGEIIKSSNRAYTESCPHCTKEGHAKGAKFCDQCGGILNP